jgi:hypothetical protein
MADAEAADATEAPEPMATKLARTAKTVATAKPLVCDRNISSSSYFFSMTDDQSSRPNIF